MQKSTVKPWATTRHAKCDDYNGVALLLVAALRVAIPLRLPTSS
jgi:hypothetical protein